jgi:hypothetical protein
MKRTRADWPALRDALWMRSNGLCEVSGRPLDRDTFDAHHRRNKGMGGTYREDTDTLPNLLALDPIVHNGGPGSVHADRNGVSGPRGWLVSKLSTEPLDLAPVLVALSLNVRQWVLLVGDQRIPIGPPLPLGYVSAGRLRLGRSAGHVSPAGLTRVDWTPEELVRDRYTAEAVRRELAEAGVYVMPSPLPVLRPPGE